jgi:uncharacterized protein YdaU (DUF1376 family)
MRCAVWRNRLPDMADKKNSASAWMPLYIGDYLSDTTRLTTEQHGAYMLLIMDYWMNGPLPNDERTLAQICRMSFDAWSNSSSILRAFFEAKRGRLHHKRIDAEKEAAIILASKRTDKAHAAALARWSREKGHQDATSNAPSIDAPSNAQSNAPAVLEICQPQSQSQPPVNPPSQGGGDRWVVDAETGEIENDPFGEKVISMAGRAA